MIPRQGIAAHLQLATPDMYACSSLDPGLLTTGSPDVVSEPGDTHRDNNVGATKLMIARRSLKAGWRRDDRRIASSAESSLKAVLVSRSILHEKGMCTFETKVSARAYVCLSRERNLFFFYEGQS